VPYEHLNRNERRAMAAYSREEAAKRPLLLTELPREKWPPDYRNGPSAPVRVWQSQKYLAQLFDAGACPMPPTTMLRLSICRATLNNDGRWEEGLEWEELMQIKREIGYGDWYAVEVYPRDHDIVNVANMRHLWLLAQPMNIGWFKRGGHQPGESR
jgi:hypothetical protein